MRLHKVVTILLTLCLVGCSSEDQADSVFGKAKEMAAKKRQPVLIEFTSSNENCGDCALAVRTFDSDPSLTSLQNTYAFCRLDVDSAEGSKLAEAFGIGIRLPAYLLTDSQGDEIYRFTGFYDPKPFLRNLSRAQNDLTTVKARIKRMQSFPNVDDALSLGMHFSSTGKPAEAVNYFRMADELNPRADRHYKFEVFNAAAGAAWNGEMSFEDVEAEADAVLNAEYRRVINTARVMPNLTKLAIRTGDTDRLERFLNLAVENFEAMSDDNSIRIKTGFMADRALFAHHDTTGAIALKRESFGPAFRRTPDNYYDFAVWCIERRVNLDESEQILNDLFDAGTLKGKNVADKFYQLARLENGRGNLKGAVDLAEQAVTIDPMNPIFVNQLEEYRQEL